MDFDGSLKELGAVNVNPLIEKVLGMEEQAWRANEFRQNAYAVHYKTESLVLLFCDGWPDLTISREAAWDDLHMLAEPLMNGILEEHYPPGGTIIRAMAAKLKAGSIITPHRDSHESFAHSHRIHLPLTTNPGVRFMINGRPHRLKVGQAYEINNQLNHSVMNNGKEDRITFIFDYLPAN
jgi:hypothetical protein